MKWKEFDSQICSVKRALPVFGDRWTLAIVRDAFMGLSRFSEFQSSLGISRHRLSDRLQRLVGEQIFEKKTSLQGRPIYVLTPKGKDLLPVLLSIAQWGDKYLADDDGQPFYHFHKSCGAEIKAVDLCQHCGEKITSQTYGLKQGPGIKAKLKRGESIPEITFFDDIL